MSPHGGRLAGAMRGELSGRFHISHKGHIMPNANGEPTEEEAVEAIYSYAAQRMRDGLKGKQLVDDLVEQGLDRESAWAVVKNLVQAGAGADRSGAMKHLIVGGIILAIGIAVTVGTYSAASAKGGSYTVAYGAIIFGAIELFVGLFQLATGKSD
ncbi:MAG: hypothetical protein WD768_07375 [Phycisphaeraceae bacterium]